jgi:hypothetical protein
MSKTATFAGLLLTAFLLQPLPAAAAISSGRNSCQGDFEVQVGPYNNYGCSDCTGSVIVQVGHTNDVECRGQACNGNIIVQAGVDNSAECASGLVPGAAQSSLAVQPPPCPPPLPEDNFYCHLAGRLLPEDFCLTLDFCLW